MVNRLNKEMRKVVKKDTTMDTNPIPDQRQIVRPENFVHLLGFDFNEKATLRAVFNVAYRTKINRETGEYTIKVSSFKPSSAIRGPKNATHFKIIFAAMEIDFYNKTENHTYKNSSEIFIIDNTFTIPLTMTHNLTPGSTATLCITVGLAFIDQTGNYFTTRDQQRVVNPLSLVDISI